MTISFPVCAQQTQNIDPESGFVIDRHWKEVRAVCTVCHSAKLVIQNRMNRQGWLDTIRWMQKEHGLIVLADLEEPILDYLARNYNVPGNHRARRRNLHVQ